jgi:hypothetical protein
MLGFSFGCWMEGHVTVGMMVDPWRKYRSLTYCRALPVDQVISTTEISLDPVAAAEKHRMGLLGRHPSHMTVRKPPVPS